jgi:hypothetical protein
MRISLLVAAVPAVALLGCGGESDLIYVNSGALCLSPAGDTVRADVRLHDCLSSSCNRLRSGACSLAVRGGILQVSSRLVIDR